MSGLFGAIASGLERKASGAPNIYSSPFAALIDWGAQSKSGISVNEKTALQVTTVFACVRVLAEGIGQLPASIYLNRRIAENHAVHKLVHRRPNEWQTPFEWREGMVVHAVLTGNAYSIINRDGKGRIRELIPLVSTSVTPIQSKDYELTYEIKMPGGGKPRIEPRDRILHLRGPSWDSYSGLEALKLAREAVGLAAATEETHARLHANGARPSGMLISDKQLNEKQVTELRTAWEAANAGVSNAMKTAILHGGLKWEQLSLSGVDAQHLETRRFQIEEICRALRVFPLMVMHADKTATFASAEQFFLSHVVHSLDPWATRLEQAIDRDLLGEIDTDAGYGCKLNRNALLRGASKDRADVHAKSLGAGGAPAWKTQDEVREDEDLPPLGGDAAKLPKPTNVAPSPGGAGDDGPPKEGDDDGQA